MSNRLGVLACALLALGCGRSRESARAAPGPLAVEFGGCVRVVDRGTCVLGPRRVIHLWVSNTRGEDLAVTAEHATVALATPRAAQGGTALEVTVPASRRTLEVTATRADGTLAAWALPLASDDAPAWLGEATELRARGSIAEAERLLASAASERERAWATGQRARVALGRNEVDHAASLLREAIALDRAAGLTSNEGDDTAALSFLLAARLHDTRGALQALADAAPAFARYSEGKTDELYARGIVMYEAGDWRAALRIFAETTVTGERLALDETVRSARATTALQLEYLGRWREALESLQAIADSDGPTASPCAHASVLVNIGEGRLLADEAGKVDGGDPLPPLEEAIAIHRGACSDAYDRALALSNAAQAVVRRGDARRARAFLAEARAAVPSPEPYLEACFSEVEGRVALLEKRYDAARDAFAREERIGAEVLFPVERWRGALGRGEALESLGQRAGAVAAYEAAERALDDAIARVPLEEGRETFLADREASARALVELLVRMGKPEQALLRARATRARVLTTLVGTAQIEALSSDARQRWLAAIDEYRRARAALAAEAGADWRRTRQDLAGSRATRRNLEARARAILDGALASVDRRPARAAFAMPPDGELLLAWFPVRHGWMAFAATAGRVRAVPFELPAVDAAPAVLSRALLDPFASELARASSVLLLPHGAAQSIDIHALPFEGRPLNATAASRYVVDLDDAPEGRGNEALVLSDPTADLQAARAEGVAVRAALERAGGWPVKALTGMAITPAALAAELPAAALVHFAGHAAYEGRDGWESAFALAGGARWSVGDVLALTHSPPRVVLSACEAARSSTDSAEGIGLAQAFLVAGARVVMAPARAVEDDLARAMSEALYAAMGRGSDLVAALHDAQEVVRASRPAADWSAFRAVSR